METTKEEFIKNLDWKKIYIFQHTAEYGMKMAVYSDGYMSMMTANTRPMDESQVVFYASAYGVGNIDQEYFTDRFCEYDEDSGMYRITSECAPSEEVGMLVDWTAVVSACSEEAFEDAYQDEFLERIEEFFNDGDILLDNKSIEGIFFAQVKEQTKKANEETKREVK